MLRLRQRTTRRLRVIRATRQRQGMLPSRLARTRGLRRPHRGVVEATMAGIHPRRCPGHRQVTVLRRLPRLPRLAQQALTTTITLPLRQATTERHHTGPLHHRSQWLVDTIPALAAAATAAARVPAHRLLLREEAATLAAAGVLEEGMLAEGMPREGTPAVHMVVAAAALRHSHFQARLHRRFEAPLLHRPALRLRCLSSNRRRLCSNRHRLCSNRRQPSSNRRKRRRASRCSDRGYFIGHQSLSPYY